MIHGKKVLGLIPARGGSKGVPRKNLRPLRGKPLLHWSLDVARESRYLDAYHVTSDDAEILACARDGGDPNPLLRPSALSQDHSPTMEAVFHALETFRDFHYVVLLQPTSPFRTASDIDETIRLCVGGGAPAAVSITLADKPPEWMYRLQTNHLLDPYVTGPQPHRRQDTASLYALNGAVYVAKIEWLKQSGGFLSPETLGFPMPKERSLDIDTELDFRIADLLATHGAKA